MIEAVRIMKPRPGLVDTPSTAPIIATGNMLVKFKPGVTTAQAVNVLKSSNAGVATASDYGASFHLDSILQKADAFVLERIGVAVLRAEDADEFRIREDRIASAPEIAAMVPEFYVFSSTVTSEEEPPYVDTDSVTWGVQAVGGVRSTLNGCGIRIGVLDTGFDGSHPDFSERDMSFWSAVGASADIDRNGHGTHCTGTAAGPDAASDRPRYGVAPGAAIRVYKVLNDGGFGKDSDVLAGIDQAVADGCEVITMSFGRSAPPKGKPNDVYELTASQVLDAGSLLIAAAGNSSYRELGLTKPIEYPANSPSIMAVAALDRRLRVADYSCGAVARNTRIDIAAPGSEVFSSFTMPRRYHCCRGTSMAVPHVAGVASLWAQSNPALRGRSLWRALIETSRPLPDHDRDVGQGLAYAPTS